MYGSGISLVLAHQCLDTSEWFGIIRHAITVLTKGAKLWSEITCVCKSLSHRRWKSANSCTTTWVKAAALKTLQQLFSLIRNSLFGLLKEEISSKHQHTSLQWIAPLFPSTPCNRHQWNIKWNIHCNSSGSNQKSDTDTSCKHSWCWENCQIVTSAKSQLQHSCDCQSCRYPWHLITEAWSIISTLQQLDLAHTAKAAEHRHPTIEGQMCICPANAMQVINQRTHVNPETRIARLLAHCHIIFMSWAVFTGIIGGFKSTYGGRACTKQSKVPEAYTPCHSLASCPSHSRLACRWHQLLLLHFSANHWSAAMHRLEQCYLHPHDSLSGPEGTDAFRSYHGGL